MVDRESTPHSSYFTVNWPFEFTQRLRNVVQNFCDGWALTTLLLDPVQ